MKPSKKMAAPATSIAIAEEEATAADLTSTEQSSFDAPTLDPPQLDTSPIDTSPDTPPLDTSTVDTSTVDTSPVDTSPLDTPPLDAPPLDAPPLEAPSGATVDEAVALPPNAPIRTPPAPTPQNTSGWYPDPEDSGGLRFWDGANWTEHRARLALAGVPALPAAHTTAHTTAHAIGAAAICACGVVAVGTCRACNRPYCRAHISEAPIEDRAYLLRWPAWTCNNCLEDDQRAARAGQLARCESVAERIATIPKMSRVRTITGLRPPMVNLFQRSDIAGVRPARHARAYLIEYDGGEPDSTNVGLAITADGQTVYDVGESVSGVPTARIGPKVSIRGYLIRKEITLDALREASARSTKDPWFEFAARAYLRAGKRLGIKPVETDG